MSHIPHTQLTLPATVNWDALDSTLLAKYWKAHPEERALVGDEYADRALIFHRGFKIAHMEGYFYDLKIDALLSFFVLQPVWAFLLRLAKMVGWLGEGSAETFMLGLWRLCLVTVLDASILPAFRPLHIFLLSRWTWNVSLRPPLPGWRAWATTWTPMRPPPRQRRTPISKRADSTKTLSLSSAGPWPGGKVVGVLGFFDLL